MDLTLAICMYNAERYIKETLKSIMTQTMQNFHLLIINDCSSDDSVKIVKQFFEIHPRQYELVNFENNHGIAYARNCALNNAFTKYILYIDADDVLDPRIIEKEYDTIISDNDLIGVSCYSRYINERGEYLHGGTYLGETTKEGFWNKADSRKLIFLPIHTTFDREKAIKAGGFTVKGFPDCKPRYSDYCEELDLWTRMSDYYSQGKAFITIPEVLYYYRKSNGLSFNHFCMIIKMRYVKTNLLRRRTEKKELTFIEFQNSLSIKEISRLKKDAAAADALRNGVFYLKEKSFCKGTFLVLKSIWYRPGYIFDKIKHNLLIK